MGRGVYYGWANVAMAALAMAATLPGRTQGLGLVTEPLMADLGIDRVTYAKINLWATIIGAACCIPFGRLLDRFGPRTVTTALLIALGAATGAMASVTTVGALAATVTLTWGLGQSALSVASISLVGKWFGRRLHSAMAVYAVLVAIGFIAAFPTVGYAVLQHGWRTAWMAVGVAIGLPVAALTWGVVRNRPPEGGTEFVVPENELGVGRIDYTLGQALRGSAFWIFALASALFGLVYSGIALFNQSILEQRGFDASTYHQALVISTMVGLAANFGGGWLAMRWTIQRVMGIGMAVLAVSLAMLPYVQTFGHVVIYAATMGAAGGLVTVVFFSVWPQAFGRAHLGRIQGAAQMTTVLASAVGPLLLAEALARTGSYNGTFLALAGVTLGFAIACWAAKMPRREIGQTSL